MSHSGRYLPMFEYLSSRMCPTRSLRVGCVAVSAEPGFCGKAAVLTYGGVRRV